MDRGADGPGRPRPVVSCTSALSSAYSTPVRHFWRPDLRHHQHSLSGRSPGWVGVAPTPGSVLLVAVTLVALVSVVLPSQERLPPLTIRGGIGVAQQGIEFPLPGVTIGADTLRFAPNTPLYLLVGAAWRSLGATAAVTLPGSLDAVEERGVSDYTNLQLQFYRRRLAIDLGYQRHLGLYLANADEVSPSPPETRLSDLRLETISTTVMWTASPTLNLTALYRLNQLHKGSTIALIWMAAASRVAVDAPTGPGATISGLDGWVWSEPMSIESISAVVGPGIAGVATIQSFFLAPLVSFGLGLQRTRYDAATGSGVEANIVPQLSVRLSAGYNAPAWFTAIIIVVDARNVQTPFLEATQTSSRVEIVLGRRYRMSRWQGTRGLDVRPSSSPSVSRPSGR
jgi:hypothetical protein